MSLSDEEEVNVEGKKRSRNPTEYKKYQITNAKVTGKELTNFVGKVIPARKTGPECGCTFQCFQKFSTEERLEVLKKINLLDGKVHQDIYLQGLITAVEVVRKRARTDVNNKPRSSNYKYYVLNGSNRIKVCKKAYISLHGVTEKRVRRLASLLLTGETPVEKRGGAHHVISDDAVQAINEHILSFPLKTARYSGKDIKYLDSRLNVKRMYNMFLIRMEMNKSIKYEFYLRQFNYNHMLRFGRPQKDTCSVCEELGMKVKSPVLNDTAKRVAAADLMVHKRRAKKFYTSLAEVTDLCKTDKTTAGICIDYMQNMPLPHIPVQEIFYLRQLWVFAFCVHNLGTGEAVFFVYHEGEARKGPDEVCSFLQCYIEEYIQPEAKHLYVFSDGCPGQNKNNTLVRFWLSQVSTQIGRFDQVSCYYPVRGHSFLPCDRDFGTVKMLIKRADRVYTPDEYIAMIISAREKKPFVVKKITTEDIVGYKAWWPQYYQKTSLSVSSKRPGVQKKDKVSFLVSKYQMLHFLRATEGTVKAWEHINDRIHHTFSLRKNKNKALEKPSAKAYTEQVPLNEKKVGDLRKVIQHIEPAFIKFYESILEWKTTAAEDDE